MCGRYASTRSVTDLTALFDAVDETDGTLVPDYNVAPTDMVPIVRRTSRMPEAVLSAARWGLVPPWARDVSGAARMINARSETVATSRVFAQPLAQRRCLVPADGWYEWQRVDGRRQPFFLTRYDGEPLVFAGVWSVWGSGEGRLLTFSVLTTAAAGVLATVHDRMPLLLEPDRWGRWLTGPSDPTTLLAPASPRYLEGIELRPVSARIGDVRNDGPELIVEQRSAAVRQPDQDVIHPTLF